MFFQASYLNIFLRAFSCLRWLLVKVKILLSTSNIIFKNVLAFCWMGKVQAIKFSSNVRYPGNAILEVNWKRPEKTVKLKLIAQQKNLLQIKIVTISSKNYPKYFYLILRWRKFYTFATCAILRHQKDWKVCFEFHNKYLFGILEIKSLPTSFLLNSASVNADWPLEAIAIFPFVRGSNWIADLLFDWFGFCRFVCCNIYKSFWRTRE